MAGRWSLVIYFRLNIANSARKCLIYILSTSPIKLLMLDATVRIGSIERILIRDPLRGFASPRECSRDVTCLR
jgi:hypothetical protein